MYGLQGVSDRYLDAEPSRRPAVNRAFQAFVELDAQRRAWLSREAASERRTAQQRLRHERDLLLALTRHGLERRIGERLVEDENVWVHLAARLGVRRRTVVVVPGVRVCEQCGLVFRATRAERCQECRRRPVRIRINPAHAGGWHIAYRVGDRFAGEDFDRVVHYIGRCVECTALFEATDPRQHLCENCRRGSGRVRRSRGSASRTGRQRFRYVHAEGAEQFSLSMARPDGSAVSFEAVDGVIETDDAEVARQLNANFTVRRLDASR